MESITMNKLHETIIPIYGMNLIFSQDPVKVCKYFHSEEDIDSVVAGYCIWDSSGTHLGIYAKYDEDNPKELAISLAHECFHAAMKLAGTVGLVITSEDNESVAYLISCNTA